MQIPAYKMAASELVANKEQFDAYNSTGHFVVLAGPGSGKTKVLTTKLARLLTEDVMAPRGVACVTYSNECARELKRRLARLGVQPSRRAFIGTVHSFCFQHVVVPYAKLGGLEISYPIRVASDGEQSKCFQDALYHEISRDENPSHWTFRCSAYRRKFIDRTSAAWQNSDIQARLVVERFEKNLRSMGLIDFDDMMLLGLRLIEENRWVRTALQAKFPILVVDEYQDLGVPLHRLVLSLCFAQKESSIRLFAVGDPDQSIYGFTGAEPQLLNELSQRSDVLSTTLKMNYRSRQYIISASEIALGEERGYKSANKDVGVIDFHHCKNGLRHQAEYIRDQLIPQILTRESARSHGEVAILYRTKYEGDVVAEAMSGSKFEFVRIDGNAAYPKTPLTRWLEECADWCSTHDIETAPSLRGILGDYLSLNRTLISESSKSAATKLLVSTLQVFRKTSVTLEKWLDSLDTKCLRKHLTADPTMKHEVVVLDKLKKNTAEGGKLYDWTVARFGGQGGSPNHLNLMTLHSSKGLEFDVVFLFGMDQGIIPNYWEKTPESKREPKRLFYVGITRARHEVHLTYSGWVENKGRIYRNGASEFVIELAERLNET